MRYLPFLLVGVLALSGFLAGPLDAQSPPASDRAPVLMPGDLIRITIWRNPELSGEFLIAADSTIRHPLYREVKVAGLPLPVVEQRLYTFLEAWETNPHLAVEPLFRVAVTGAVVNPGLLTVDPEALIPEAIAMAGGVTREGRPDRVRVVREGRVFWVDLMKPQQTESLRVRSGDQITVLPRRDIVRDLVLPIGSVTGVIASIISIGLLLSR